MTLVRPRRALALDFALKMGLAFVLYVFLASCVEGYPDLLRGWEDGYRATQSAD